MISVSPGERLGTNTYCPAGCSGPALKLGLASFGIKAGPTRSVGKVVLPLHC